MAGRISTWSMFSGLSVLFLSLIVARLDAFREGIPCLVIGGILTMVVTGPVAALVDIVYVIRLKLLGAKGLGWPVVLALPAAIVSTLLTLTMMGVIR